MWQHELVFLISFRNHSSVTETVDQLAADIQATGRRRHLHFLDVKSQRRCSRLDFWVLYITEYGVDSKMFTNTFSLHLHECIDGMEHSWQCAPCLCPVWRKHRTPHGVLVPVRVVMCRQRNAVGLGYVTTRHFDVLLSFSEVFSFEWRFLLHGHVSD